MKNKNKIIEGALDMGIQSYSQSTTPASTSGSKTSTINVKKKDLGDPNVQKNLSKIKGVTVNVVEEKLELIGDKLIYLSDVKDLETNEISKPFTIDNKQYQMVRALTPDKKKVMGVYSLDETDENGENIIYSVEDFEKNIAKNIKSEEGVVEPEGPEMNTIYATEDISNDTKNSKDETHPSFEGYKHYIVNKKTKKARKFKTIEELAKASMTPDEEYMGIKNFKRYVDETLFGASKKKPMVEVDNTISKDDIEMNKKAKKLMGMIKSKIPENIINTIANDKAKAEVIATFAEMIGVPRNGLGTLISSIKNLSKSKDLSKSKEQPVTEKRIIKVKDLI